MFIIFMGLISLGLLGQIAYRLNSGAALYLQPVHRGVGAVVAGTADGDGSISGTITIEIDTGQDVFTVDTHVPSPYWSALKAGDTVAVLYRMNKLGNEIHLVECGLVALPDTIR